MKRILKGSLTTLGIIVIFILFLYYEASKARCDKDAYDYGVPYHEIHYRSCMRQAGF